MEFFDSIDYPISFSTKTAFYNAESNLAHAHNNLCDIVRLGDIADFFEDVVHRSDLL